MTMTRYAAPACLLLCSFLLCSVLAAPLAAQSTTVSVSVGDRDRTDALVSLELPKSLADTTSLHLVELNGQQTTPVAAQFDSTTNKLWFVARGTIPANRKRTYRLVRGEPEKASLLAVIETEGTIQIRHGDRSLLQYNKAHVEPPAGVDEKYGRSGHIHPVWTPSGAIVTDELPPDHLHQSGIFFAFTKTQFENRDVDFWNLAGGKGRVRFKSAQATVGGPIFAAFRTEQEHVDLTTANEKAEIGKQTGGKVALVESWEVRAWSPGPNANYWLMDIDSSIRCAGESPLKLPEYHYGGMAIRAARPWVPKEVTFLTSEGDSRIPGNHKRARWCDIHGLVDSKEAGIALFTNPQNFRFPEPLRIHPTMPYMVYTPQFLGAFEIAPGTIHHTNYRFVIHDGQLSANKLEQLWQNYAAPLQATIE